MAITLGSTTEATPATASNTLTFSHAVAGGTDCLFVTVSVFHASAGSRTVSGVTFNGGAMTAVPSSVGDDGAFCNSSLWYTLNPTATTANVVVTIDLGNSADILTAGATNFSGVHQTVPFGTAAVLNNNTTGDPISVNVTAAAGDYTVGVVATDAQGGITPVGGTELWEVENVASDISAGAQYYTSSGTVTVQWDLAAAVGGAISAVAIKPAAGGGGRVTKNTRAFPLGTEIGMGWRM